LANRWCNFHVITARRERDGRAVTALQDARAGGADEDDGEHVDGGGVEIPQRRERHLLRGPAEIAGDDDRRVRRAVHDEGRLGFFDEADAALRAWIVKRRHEIA
jgi:hypothetical protein